MALTKSQGNTLEEQIYSLSQSLRGGYDLDSLLHLTGDARYVLLGRASYGTSEDFLWRVRLSQRLIHEKCFSFVAVEGDWADCYKVNRYVKSYSDSGSRAYDVLNNLRTWPSWVWANWQTVAFVEWLREYNSLHKNKTGFYGLDAFNLWNSLGTIEVYLKKNYPDYLDTFKRAYSCFEPFSGNGELYTWTPGFVPDDSIDEAAELLSSELVSLNNQDNYSETDLFVQNSSVTKGAEAYYRILLKGGSNSWNSRETSMANLLNRLKEFYGKEARGIIWMQNSHFQNTHASVLHKSELTNLGRLIREQNESEGVITIGSGIYSGEVIAAKKFGDSPEMMKIPEAHNGSIEEIFHKSGADNKLIILKDMKESEDLSEKHSLRNIGVTYNQEKEKTGNYSEVSFSKLYDAFIFIDNSPAVNPLHPEKENINPPGTYPWGM